MRDKIFLIHFLLLPITVYAAFSEKESSELIAINSISDEELNSITTELNKSVAVQVNNNPERKFLISELKRSWDDMINKKCSLETIESKGTDAEKVNFNNCLVKNYKEEIKYFDSMLP